MFRVLTPIALLAIWTIPMQASATACENIADKTITSCKVGASSDRFLDYAHCTGLTDAGARQNCRDEADVALEEAREECREQRIARLDACDALGENRYRDPLEKDINFIDPDRVPNINLPNPYVSVAAGRTLVLRAGEEDNWEETVVIHVSDDTREVNGVPCRVVWDVAVEVVMEDDGLDYEPVEVTQDWFAQSGGAGDVYYCGENSLDYEDDVVASVDGSFESGVDNAAGGLLIRSMPMVGEVHRQEYDLDDAEDIVEYLSLSTTPPAEEGGENPAFSCADAGGCLKTLDYTPLEPSESEYKYYIDGVGFVLAVVLEDGKPTGEREELVCAGDSLDVLSDPACGIEDIDALLNALCEVAADGFCE